MSLRQGKERAGNPVRMISRAKSTGVQINRPYYRDDEAKTEDGGEGKGLRIKVSWGIRRITITNQNIEVTTGYTRRGIRIRESYVGED